MNDNKRLKIAYKISKLVKCDLKDVAKLSSEQIAYVNRGLRECSLLQACPGSGKTEVIGIKSAVEISKWNNSNGGIALMTFTTSAAKELLSRTNKYCRLESGTHPHFIGTFDSWLHNFILHPFSHYMTGYAGKEGDKSVRIIEHDTTADFMHNYETIIDWKGRKLPIMASEYYYRRDWNDIVGETNSMKSIISSGLKSDEIKQLRQNKLKFLQAGFATYSDAEFLSLRLLAKFPILSARLAKRFPALIIDECQDLSEVQISILDTLRSFGSNLDFVGDLNQAIYEFRDVDPKVLDNYVEQQNFKRLYLTKNFRSNQHIVDVTGSLIKGLMKISANISPLAQTSCLLWQYDESNFSELPRKFKELVLLHSLRLEHSAILARGKSTLDPLRIQHQKNSYTKVELFAIGLHCWCKPYKTTDDIVNAIKYTGKFVFQIAYVGRPDVRNQFCPEYISPIRWRIMIKDFLNAAKHIYQSGDNAATWKSWCSLVKIFLKSNWEMFELAQTDMEAAMNKVRSPSKRGDNQVREIYDYLPIQNNFRTTTIHSVKGETLDAVMLVSHKNRSSQGGHYSNWFQGDGTDEEHLRFAYVAFSRPKHFLVLAVPKLKSVDLQKLSAMGFQSS